MKRINFLYLALGLGVFLMLIASTGSKLRDDGSTAIPLFTLLAISEVAFFVSAFGVYSGIKHTLSAGVNAVHVLATALCFGLAIRFVFIGMALWPN